MKLNFVTLDVFTTTRYAGNPLAIVLVPTEHEHEQLLSQTQKQNIAREFNLSETVFLHAAAAASGRVVAIDIFTSQAEIPFAGHPTIGSAWYVLQQQQQRVEALQTRAGRVPIALEHAATGRGQLLVRAAIPHHVHTHARTFTSSLSLSSEASPVVSIVRGMTFILAHVPDLAALSQARRTLYDDDDNPEILDDGWREGLIGTLFYAPQGRDPAGCRVFRTRMHDSHAEDPATGSASCALGAHLALHEPRESGPGPFRYVMTQGVEMGKKSDIVVEVMRAGPGVIDSIFLSGSAVMVMQGTLEV